MEVTKKNARDMISCFAYSYFNALKINALTSSLMNTYIDEACGNIMNNGYLDVFELISKGIVDKEEAFEIITETANSIIIDFDWTEETYFSVLNNVNVAIKDGLTGLKSKLSLDLTYCTESNCSRFKFKLKEGE